MIECKRSPCFYSNAGMVTQSQTELPNFATKIDSFWLKLSWILPAVLRQYWWLVQQMQFGHLCNDQGRFGDIGGTRRH